MKDSTNLREKDKMRQWSFENYQSSFPAPKKSNWTLGIQKGFSWVTGDVRAERGFGIGLNVRIPVGHMFSIRAASSIGTARGLNWRPHSGVQNNEALNGTISEASNYTLLSFPYVYYNFRMSYADINLQGVFSLANLSFYNKEPKVGAFLFGGFGGFLYNTTIDALDENGVMYDFSGVPGNSTQAVKQDALNSLKILLDGNFETPAESYSNKTILFNRNFIPDLVAGGGVTARLSKRVDIAVEHRVTITNDDLLDGFRWEETNTLTSNFDLHQWTTLGFNIQIGKGEDSKWWTNPMKGLYEDLRSLKSERNKKVNDEDSDGVPDASDKEPKTPKGARVDVMGVAIDSDEDGIKDFQDKQPFTARGAKVDKEGVARDSDNDGVADFQDAEPNTAAGTQVDVKGVTIKQSQSSGSLTANDLDAMLPLIHFDKGISVINSSEYSSLNTVARLMLNQPNLKMRVTGHTDEVVGKSTPNPQLSKERAEKTIDFLVTNFGIAKERFLIEYMSSDDPVVKNLPKNYSPQSEGLHLLNRRVEFHVARD